MKLLLIAFCLVLFVTHTVAQLPQDDPKDNVLVDCGSEKAAIFGGTESPDGHYALGWTLRPKPGKPPVDWSSYHRENFYDWMADYPQDEETSLGGYILIDGVLDLRAKRFAGFNFANPYRPHGNHGNLHPVWLKATLPIRYAVVYREGKLETLGIWLVTINKSIKAVEILPGVDKAAEDNSREHTDQSRAYRVSFPWIEPDEHPKPLTASPKINSINIPFCFTLRPEEVEVAYDGNVTVTLPKGTVVRVTGKKSE